MILLSAIFERTVTDRIQHIEKLISKADGGTPLEYDLWREGDGKQDLTLFLRRLVPIMECLIADKRFAGHQYLEFDLRERVCFDPPPLHRARPSMNAESLRRRSPGTVRLTPPPRPGHRARHSACASPAPCASVRRRGAVRVTPPPHSAAHAPARQYAAPGPCASVRQHLPGAVRVTPPPMRRRVSLPPQGRARQSANTSPAPCASLRRPGTMRVTPPPRHRVLRSAAPAPCASEHERRVTPAAQARHRAPHSTAPARAPCASLRRPTPPPRHHAPARQSAAPRPCANTSPAECASPPPFLDLGRFNDQFQQARTAHSPASGPMPELESTDSR